MTGVIRRGLGVLVLLLLSALAAAALLLGTRQGTRLLVSSVQDLSGGALQVQSVHGHFLSELELSGIRFTLGGRESHIGRLYLRWLPGDLRLGLLHLEKLALSDARLDLPPSSNDTPASTTSFDPADLPMALRLDDLAVESVELARPDQPPLRLQSLAGALRVSDGELRLDGVQLRLPEGSVRAGAQLGLSTPYPVQAELDWQWRHPATGPLAGTLRVAGDRQRLQATHEGRGALPVHLDLTLNDALGQANWQARLHWPAFTPAQPLGPGDLRLQPGELVSTGGLADYSVTLNLQHGGAGLPEMAWHLAGQGDHRHLDIRELRLDLLSGTVRGDGRLTWQPDIAAELQLRASDLDLRPLAGVTLPPTLDAVASMAVERSAEQWRLQRFSLSLPRFQSRLDLDAAADLSDPQAPQITADLNWSQLRWPLSETPQVTSAEGGLSIAGNPDAYRGELQAQLSAPQLDRLQLRLAASGDRNGMKLEPAVAQLLGGSLEVRGGVRWVDTPTTELTLAARDLDPSPLLPGWPDQTRLSADGHLAFDGKRATLTALQLRPLPGDARITLDGWAEPAPSPLDSALSLDLRWSALAWPLQGAPALAASPEGALQVTGTPADYRLRGGLQLEGVDIPPGRWTLKARGSPKDLSLESLHGDTLDGTLDMSGALAWAGQVRWDLALLGRGLNPGVQLPDLPGTLSLDTRVQGHLDTAGAPQAELDLKRLEGRLLDRPLKLQGKLTVSGDRYRLAAMRLASGRNRVELDGGLAGDRLDLTWKLALPDPGGMLPGAAGRLTGQGRLGGSLASPSLRASLQGDALALGDLRLRTLSADLDARLADRAPLALRLQAAGLERGQDSLVNRADIGLDGRMDAHRLTLDVQAPTQRLRATLAGGADTRQGAWRGQLRDLKLDSDALGNWQLTAPAVLLLTAKQSRLERACLAYDGSSGRLCAALEHLADSGSRLDVELAELAVEQLLPAVQASLSARVNGSLGADGSLRAQASGELSEGNLLVRLGGRQQRLAHRGGSLTAVIDQGGLNAQLRLSPLQQGILQASLKLVEFNRLPIPEGQPIAGTLQADIPDLAPLQAFVPQLSNTRGRLQADMALGGRLPLPGIQGTLELRDGAADIELVGMQLRDLGLALRADPDNPGRWLLAGGAKSGAGWLRLSGGGGIDGRDTQLRVNGRDFAVVDSPHARVNLDPDLNLGWDGERMRVRGQVYVPLAEITPQLDLTGSLGGDAEQTAAQTPGRAIAPSPDVVILQPETGEETRDAGEAADALPLDSEVLIALGERVTVDAVGFRCRIAGELTLINPPGRADPVPLARGRLILEDGAYRSFGQDLEIDPNSQLVFNGGPVSDPELNLRAIRWIRNDDQVNAVGVSISGSLDKPRMHLFSEPQLDEQTIHSYLLTGKSPDSGEKMLSVGTRLNEDLYVGYGVNLLNQTHEFNLRYDILRWFSLEADVGEADKNVTFSYTLER
jgi:translocation and assembly module TamB